MDKDGREILLEMTRRQFFGRTAKGIGVAALASLLGPNLMADEPTVDPKTGGLAGLPHFAPKAKRVIFLHQSGAPSQMDLFDYKPKLQKSAGHGAARLDPQGPADHRHDLGPGVLPGRALHLQVPAGRQVGHLDQRAAAAHGQDRRRHRIIKTMNTEAINHDPAITFIQTGFQQPGRPSIGAWVTYGLGSENQNLPAFVVLISQANAEPGSALFSRLWGSGFLPSKYQGVKFRAGGDPVLYLDTRRASPRTAPPMLDGLAKLNKMRFDASAIPRSRRASRSTRWPTACKPRCPS